jgi:hypothetical protein
MSELTQIEITETFFGELTQQHDSGVDQIKVYEDSEREVYFLATDVYSYVKNKKYHWTDSATTKGVERFCKNFRSPREICKKKIILPRYHKSGKNSSQIKECNFLTRNGMVRAAAFCKNDTVAAVCFREFINAVCDSIYDGSLNIESTLDAYHETMISTDIEAEITEITETSPGLVYFIQDVARGYTKIGRTSDLVARISTLQTGNPDELTVYKTVKCTEAHPSADLEKELHEHFAEHHVRGEWFDITNDQIDEVCHSTL